MNYSVKVNNVKWIGCGICVRICPTGTLSINKERKAFNTRLKCDNLFGCIHACPTNTLEIKKLEKFNDNLDIA